MFFKKKRELIDIKLTQYQLKVVHMVSDKPYEIKIVTDECPAVDYDYEDNSIEWYLKDNIEKGYIRNVVTYSLLKI